MTSPAPGRAALAAIAALVATSQDKPSVKPADEDKRLAKAASLVQQAGGQTNAGQDLRNGANENGNRDRGDSLSKATTASVLLDALELVQEWQLHATKDGRAPSPEDNINMLDRRNLQLAIKHLVLNALLPACRAFADLPRPGVTQGAQAVVELSRLLSRLLRLTRPTHEVEGFSPQGEERKSDYQPAASPSKPIALASRPESNAPPLRVPTTITSTLHSISTLPIILSATILLSWSQAFPPPIYASNRKLGLELIEGMSVSESLSILGSALSLTSNAPRKAGSSTGSPSSMIWPPHVSRTLKVLLTKQLLRPRGIVGLMTNVFGTSMGKNDRLDLYKLEHLSRVIGDVASGRLVGLDEAGWWKTMALQLVDVIIPGLGAEKSMSEKGKAPARNLPERYIHAACFVISQLVDRFPDGFGKCITPLIVDPFLPALPHRLSHADEILEPITLSSPSRITSALSLLLPLLTRVPPPPTLLTLILTPIVPALFALHAALAKDPTADPLTKQELTDALRSWGRLSGEDDVVEGLMRVVRGGRGWDLADEGGNERFWYKVLGGADDEGDEVVEQGFAVVFGRPPDQLSLHPQSSDSPDIRIKESFDPDDDPNSDIRDDAEVTLPAMDLHPDPKAVVELVVSLERGRVAAKVFEECLTGYQSDSENQEYAMRALLYLQLVMLLSDKVGDKILKDRPESTLLFVEQALRPVIIGDSTSEGDEGSEGGDSDDEVNDAIGAEEILQVEDVSKLNLRETAISLLVAVLSAQEGGVVSMPILRVIEQHLKELEARGNARVRQLAQSALMVLAVCNAGGNSNPFKGTKETSQTLATYQEALKLLADPLLPVRGHGLILLQTVVVAHDFDRALLPAILDIFMQAIKDEDSFMYLNAIKGLSNMVDGLGREILQSLVREYGRDLDRSRVPEGKELDRRLRLGEALLQSVRRAGQALSRYADTVVPPLLRIFPLTRLPTIMRTSSLSILAASIETSRLALLPWLNDLIPACLDLVQIESVAAGPSPRSTDDPGKVPSPLPEPTRGNDGKHPALRRAALVLLGLAFDAQDRDQFSDAAGGNLGSGGLRLPSRTVGSNSSQDFLSGDDRLYQRAKTILGYVAGTDVDELAKHQAAEALAILGRSSFALH